MRREWSGWIKTRNWPEFEREAKSDPCQALADTVGEMALGFADKADQKALKRVLYLLRERGYEPSPIEESPSEAAPAPEPFRAAVMRSPEGRGETTFVLGTEGKDRIRWLTAVLREDAGILDARDLECPPAERDAFIRRQLAPAPSGVFGAVVPFEFAHSRISEALVRTRRVPSAVAYWRNRLDAEPMEHPALALPRDSVTEAQIREVALGLEATISWRLELGWATGPLVKLRESLAHRPSPQEIERMSKESVAEVHRTAFANESVRKDHLTRLLDLGYLLHLNGSPLAGQVLAAHDDLAARGTESPYAVGIVDKTIAFFYEVSRNDSNRR